MTARERRTTRRPGARGLAAALAAAALATGAAAEGPPCVVTTSVDPQVAFVGEQVTYTLRVLRRPDVANVSWERPLAFPSFRAEWLPGQMGNARVHESGSHYLVYEDRRALFPLRAGQIEIPSASIRCTLWGAPGDTRSNVIALVPGTAVEVREPPTADRPPGYAGIVGTADVVVQAEPRAVTLGGTVHVSVTLTGEGNLWAAPAPFEDGLGRDASGAAAELFRRAPELALEPDRRLRVRRVFSFELVPRRVGSLVIPPYELAVLDPASASYTTVRSQPISLSVAPPLAAAASPAAAAPLASTRRPLGGPDDAPGAGLSRFILPALSVALLFGAATGGVRLWCGRRAAVDPVRAEALRDADAARRAGDVAAEKRALARALRAALGRVLVPTPVGVDDGPSRDALSAEELAQRATGDGVLAPAAGVLLDHERARFGGAGSGPDAASLRAAHETVVRRR